MREMDREGELTEEEFEFGLITALAQTLEQT